MSITRAPLRAEQPYTVFANELLNDESLSAEALGVLVYLLSKPPNWKVLPGPLGKRFGCGRDRIYRIMNELIAAGYALRQQTRDDSGSFSDQNYLVSNDKYPLTENTVAGSPLPEKPHQQKKDTKKVKTDDAYSEDFEALWQAYPRTKNTSKKDAWNIYRMLSTENQERVRIAVPLFAADMRAEGRPQDKIKHMTSWLNGKMYETAAPSAAPAGTAGPAKRFWEYATEKQWANVLLAWSANWNWSESWGPEPGKPGCHVPPDLLDRFDLKYRGHLFSPEEKEAKKARISRPRDGEAPSPPAA
jgi:hypothetical protein